MGNHSKGKMAESHNRRNTMKTILLIALTLAASTAYAGTAFFQYARQTGMTQQCVYDYLGNEYTITISGVAICPLTIQV